MKFGASLQPYSGIALESTGTVTAVMLLAFASDVVLSTPKFDLGVIAATGEIFSSIWSIW